MSELATRTVVLGVGVDLCHPEQWRRVLERNTAAIRTAFAARERAWAGADSLRLAQLWAVKEAVVKALGCGFGELDWLDVRVNLARPAPAIGIENVAGLPAWASDQQTSWGVALETVHAPGRSASVLAVACAFRGRRVPPIAVAAAAAVATTLEITLTRNHQHREVSAHE